MGNLSKKKVFFRADASFEIGYGHFTRSLALADMLKENFDCVFFTCHPTTFQKQEMSKVCSFVALDETTHYETFLSYLQGDETVVLDNYFFTTDYQRQIKAKGCRLVCIDDMHDKHYVADLVINHAPGIKNSDFSCEAYTRLCLGMDYLLLRRAFLETTTQSKTTRGNSIFICFGGSDEKNLTLNTCRLLRRLTSRSIIVVVGSGYQFMNELKLFSKDNHIGIHSSIDAYKMVDLLYSATLAIVPASTTLLEACCTRIPIITGYDIDNQRFMAENCGELGIAYNCGNLCVDFVEKLETAFKQLDSNTCEDYMERQKKMITDSTDNLVQQFKLL